MDKNNARVIYRRFPEMMKKRGYINLNHRLVNSKDDLIEMASVFRDTRYETFRIIYMKNNKIVGYESISSGIPNCVILSPIDKQGRLKNEMCFYKILNRMNRLGANGYFMAHNHPSDNAVASKSDLKLTEKYAEKIKGFLGHLIINTDSYAWISIDNKGVAVAENLIKINKRKTLNMQKTLKEKSIFDVKISSRDDLVSFVSSIKNYTENSIAILTDSQGKTRMILDFPNRYLNISEKQLNGYFRNLARETGSIRVFFATNNNEAYNKAIYHQKYSTFKDVICYKDDEDKLYVYEKLNLEIPDLFNNSLCVLEESEDYSINKTMQDLEDELLENPKKKDLIILYKKVGQNPVPMKIENTLEAKQKLVGGLIEVVPLEDVLLVCNEEGKILNMKPNLVFDYDYIAGDCFVIGDDYENGDFKSLTKEEVIKYNQLLKNKAFNYEQQEGLSSNEKEKELEKLWDKFFEEINKSSSK